MKHLIIAAILCVGLVAQPGVPTDQSAPQLNDMQSLTAIPTSAQLSPQQLGADQMERAVGGDVSGCWEYIDENKDRHGVCCVDLWLFTVCVGVNLSAIERLLPF